MIDEAFFDYLYYFHGPHDYFECHEVLEELWKKEHKSCDLWVGFIQLAVSLYHMRRGNYRGAKKTIHRANQIFKQNMTSIAKLGLNPTVLNEQTSLLEKQITKNEPYQSFSLPIVDKILQKTVEKRCLANGYSFGGADCLHPDIIHKHTRRDRTDVVNARLKALNEKNKPF